MRGRRYPGTLKNQAVALRRDGRSLQEIADILQIPKNTIQGWVYDIPLTRAQHRRLQAKAIESAAYGRPLAVVAWRKKIEAWQNGIRNQVRDLASRPFTQPDIAELTLGLLYICEGSKYPTSRVLSFANSDPRMIRLFLMLLRRYCGIDEKKFRLRVMHRWDQNGEDLKRFWSHVTGIPLTRCYPAYADRRTKGHVTRRTNYRGVCNVTYFSTALQYRLQAIGESVLDLVEEQEGWNRVMEPTASVSGETAPPSYATLRFNVFPEREELPPLQVVPVLMLKSRKNGGAGGA